MLSWVNQFNICCFLDNHNYRSRLHSYECLAAAGVHISFSPANNLLDELDSFVSSKKDWIFGHFNYDIKNSVEEGLSSKNQDYTNFPEVFLFVPNVVLQLDRLSLTIGVIHGNADVILKEITSQPLIAIEEQAVTFKPRITKQAYLEIVEKLKAHIAMGDCYVINFCQEFWSSTVINPLSVYQKLVDFSPNPFSAYYKLVDKYLLCASPERYLKKEGKTVISQPIKGTSARDLENAEKDEINRRKLLESAKDRSENVMVVDLVRNDLSKVCAQGTVEVDELFAVYSYPTVHQMISTVKGELLQTASFAAILEATFPMGSMTGAPKKKVMQLIEKYEGTKRGIYSGTIGYISPSGNFDFNVVIRSLVCNEKDQYLSYQVGSAITAESVPEEEYEECLLKASAIKKVFS
jgi:para-aminobenzoate synthetase component 1